MKTSRLSLLRQQFANRLNLQVSFHCKPYPKTKQLKQMVCVALMPEVRYAQISLVITDETESRTLNQQWRQQDHPTNVLSFPINNKEATTVAPNTSHLLLGDLVLCAPIIEHEAITHNKSLIAHYALLIIHGVLHLQGYHHETNAKEAAIMQQFEKNMLAKLGFCHPYTDNELA